MLCPIPFAALISYAPSFPQAAVDFCESHARTFGGGAAVEGWVLVDGQAPSYTFKATGPVAGKTRPFACTLAWIDAFEPGMRLKLSVVPGLTHGLEFRLPTDTAVVGKALSISTKVDATAVKREEFDVRGLMRHVAPAPSEAAPAPSEASEPPSEAPAATFAAPSPAAAAPVSIIGPPVPVTEIHSRLGVEALPAEAKGDCFPLSLMCGFEVSEAETAHPSPATTESVRLARNGSIDLIAGTLAIDGVPSRTVRHEEGLPKTPVAAERRLSSWRQSYHWFSGVGGLSSAFQFSLAVHVKRTAIVLELTPDETGYLEPAMAYALRDEGVLRRTPAKPGKEETIPFSFPVPLASLETVLAGRRCSLIQYNREESHFQPLRACAVSETEAAGDDVARLAEVEDAEVAAITGEWRSLGMYFSIPVAGTMPMGSLQLYMLDIPVAELDAGDEVRFEAPGGASPSLIAPRLHRLSLGMLPFAVQASTTRYTRWPQRRTT